MTGLVAQRRGRLRSSLHALAPRHATTPGRLRLVAVAIVLGAVGFGLVGATAAATRHDAAATAADQTEPLLVQAVHLHDALADADATASATFVIGGAEKIARRRRYLTDVGDASTALTQIDRQARTAAERGAVAAIGRDLPVYTGLIDTARADNRQGFPVGAAYLREASQLMRARILPAATSIYAVEGRDLETRYGSGVSATAVVTFAGAGLLMLAVLVAAQVYLARLTHRRLNPPLVAATLVLLAVAAWGLLGMFAEQRALERAKRDGSDPVEVLSAVRALALRAQADEGLSLAARGSGEDSPDFASAMRMLGNGRSAGLLADAAALVGRRGSDVAVERLAEQLDAYRRVHDRVVGLEQRGFFNKAAELSVGTTKGRELSLADTIRADLDGLVSASQQRFDAAADDAVGAVGALWLLIPLLTLVSALLGLHGLRLRMREYR